MTIKPVADLYLITYEDGRPYKYTHEAGEAIDAIGAGFKVEEFVSLGNHRAAMLQAGNFREIPDSSTSNCREISETSTNGHEIETHTLLKSIEGMEVSVDVSTCDADAGHRYFGTVTEICELDAAKNGYILLVQDAKPNFKQAGNSPVTPDGWIPVSERMPEGSEEVLCTKEFDGPGDWRKKVGYWLAGKWTVYGASWTPTHWMPLPAAPKQTEG